MTDGKRDNPEFEVKPPTPRWVKIFAIVISLVVVVFIILHVTGNSLGNHRR